jgi:SAM-dependent methyltransferase
MTSERVQASAFDDVAQGYDDRFSTQPIAKILRAKIHHHLTEMMPPNGTILEIGCGTGVDATYFASLGHWVMATDPSQKMLDITLQRRNNRQGAGHLLTELWDANLPEKVGENGPYDVVFSNFGAVNCVLDLAHLKSQIVQLVKPGGACVLVLMNRWCMLEVVLNLLLWNPRNITRRFRQRTSARLEDGSKLDIFFPSVSGIKAAFASCFHEESYTPIGVFFPPSELYGAFQKRPWLLKLATFLDTSLGKFWPVARFADHFMIVLRRPETQDTKEDGDPNRLYSESRGSRI